MRLFSLFTGIGGLEYGLKDKCELVGWSEIRKSAIIIFNKKNKSNNYGDITKLNFEKLPNFDILIGGFPCQSFSLAGLRKGFEDRRGKMIFYIYDLLKVKKPKFVVLENVKGILNHNKGKTYEDIFRLLMSLGYYVRVVLLNSLYYGLAQNRERIFFLCSLEDFNEKIPEIIDDKIRFRDIKEKSKKYEFINLLEKNLEKIEGKRKFNFELIGGYDRVGTLTTQYGCGEKLVYEDNYKWRYLTPIECERLQGFEDNYTEGLSYNERYFLLGNAVSCNVSDYLFNNYLRGLWW